VALQQNANITADTRVLNNNHTEFESIFTRI